MATTTTTTTPPTTHALLHAQRRRLMRSTRKLGALLGETPLLIDRRSGSTSPTTAAFTPGHTYLVPVTRPTLFLRLPPAALTSSSAECTPLPSPFSPTFNLNSPAPAADASRRRKMAKLVRTLGENVPPELVFPAARVRRRASTLTSSVPEFVLERRRGDSPVPAVAVDEAEEVPRPSFNADEPFSFPSTVPFAPSPQPRASSDTSASGASASSGASGEYLLPHADRGMHRREQGWSGEWRGRVGNMDDVVRNLRGLKVK